MAWTLDIEHLEDLARGAAFLGTGGGGDPYIGRLLVEQAIEKNGPITILDPEELDDDVCVIPTAQMGAPSVIMERIPAGNECELSLKALEDHLGRKADATMPIECGGINSMIPLLVGAQKRMPVVDADGMGRAFPELQMETFAVYGVSGSPLAIGDERGHSVIIDAKTDNKRMEDLARAMTVQLGGASHIAEYAMTGEEVKRTAVPRTLSLALAAGRALRESHARRSDPVEMLQTAFSTTLYSNVRELYVGKIVDVERRVESGFTRGRARIQSDGASPMEIEFQNENLIAKAGDTILASVPDLICVIEGDTFEPITTERLRYGQRVRVVGVSTPEMMRTPEALAVFGPQGFGLNVDFIPVEERAGQSS